jgi:hypothetical protein
MSIQAFLYILAILLFILAALPIPTRGFNLAWLGVAAGLAAFSWPVITA